MKKFLQKLKLFGKDMLIIIGYFLIMVVVTYLFTIKSDDLTPLMQTIIYSILSIYLFIIFRKKLKSALKDFKKNHSGYLLRGFEIYFLSYLVMIFVQMILYKLIGSLPTNEELNREAIRNNIFHSVLQMCIFAPFQEELLFRQNFRNLFKNKIVFSIVTGVIFGSMHLIAAKSLIELPYILTYSIMGIALGYMYYDSDNIYTSMCLHSFNNTFALIITVIEVFKWKE